MDLKLLRKKNVWKIAETIDKNCFQNCLEKILNKKDVQKKWQKKNCLSNGYFSTLAHETP